MRTIYKTNHVFSMAWPFWDERTGTPDLSPTHVSALFDTGREALEYAASQLLLSKEQQQEGEEYPIEPLISNAFVDLNMTSLKMLNKIFKLVMDEYYTLEFVHPDNAFKAYVAYAEPVIGYSIVSAYDKYREKQEDEYQAKEQATPRKTGVNLSKDPAERAAEQAAVQNKQAARNAKWVADVAKRDTEQKGAAAEEAVDEASALEGAPAESKCTVLPPEYDTPFCGDPAGCASCIYWKDPKGINKYQCAHQLPNASTTGFENAFYCSCEAAIAELEQRLTQQAERTEAATAETVAAETSTPVPPAPPVPPKNPKKPHSA